METWKNKGSKWEIRLQITFHRAYSDKNNTAIIFRYRDLNDIRYV